MLEAGIRNEMHVVVTYEMTAANVGKDLLPVYSTPSMVGLMENTCASCIAPFLQEGEGSVGMAIDVKHLAATPIGMNVRCECILKEVDGRKLIFEVNAYDENGLIGIATHKRAIINNEKFMAKLKQ